ncbi:hypothetical protein PAMP_021735 [Pampus punctatissimus]
MVASGSKYQSSLQQLITQQHYDLTRLTAASYLVNSECGFALMMSRLSCR